MNLRKNKKSLPSTMNPDAISEMEFAVLASTCEGRSSSEIGKLIHRSHHTVSRYRNYLYRKLHVRNKTELVKVAAILFNL
jgi:DNA-binding CsgD family transcriptional regulator